MQAVGSLNSDRRASQGIFASGRSWSAAARLLAGRAILASLVSFHIWLFCIHAVTGRLWEPGTMLRWIAAGMILAGFLGLRRAGRPLTSGRQALVLWLLVLMLHASAVAGATDQAPAAAVPETVHVVLSQISAGPVVLLAAGLLLLLIRRHLDRPRALSLAAARRFAHGLPQAGDLFRYTPRPPPRLLSA